MTDKNKRGGARPGAGRKKEIEGATRVTVTLPIAVVERIDGAAKIAGVTRSQYMRWQLEEIGLPLPRRD